MHKPLFLNAPGSIAFSQEHVKTISYAKFGGQTECILGNWKIVNWKKGKCTRFKGFKTFQSGLATTYGKNRREIENTWPMGDESCF